MRVVSQIKKRTPPGLCHDRGVFIQSSPKHQKRTPIPSTTDAAEAMAIG